MGFPDDRPGKGGGGSREEARKYRRRSQSAAGPLNSKGRGGKREKDGKRDDPGLEKKIIIPENGCPSHETRVLRGRIRPQTHRHFVEQVELQQQYENARYPVGKNLLEYSSSMTEQQVESPNLRTKLLTGCVG
ncbi:hypothetical protein TNCV_2623651 [Trichonephila clavipes]|nr:hypothetical protein TNCV_2623651 [Trichonephila clavipes]